MSDINECAENNGCNKNAQCRNTEGSYTCKCKAGFSGNGWDCTSKYVAFNNL